MRKGEITMGNHIIPERLTWKQMQEKYPDQWLGLTDVKYLDDDGVTIESGVIKYADKTHSELLEMVIAGEGIVHCHTNPDGHFLLGMVGVL